MNTRIPRQNSLINLAFFYLLLISFLSICNGNLVCLEKSIIKDMAKQLSALSKASGKMAWPPATPSYKIDPVTGNYSIALDPLVERNKRMMDWKNYWFTRLFHLYCNKAPTGSWLKQVVTMNKAIGYKILFMKEYDYYPSMVDIKDMVQTMRAGEPLPVPPYFNPNIKLIRHPFTCSPLDNNKYDLIIIINSCVICDWWRKEARKTYLKRSLWKGLKVGFFFTLGMPAPVRFRKVKFHGLELNQRESLRKGYTQARSTDDLLKEAERYNDLLIGDYSDEFYNITLRFVIANRWASLYCSQRSPLFLYVDPQYTIVPFNVINHVKKIPAKSLPQYNAGRIFRSMGIGRGRGVYSVSHDELPYRRYPPFASRVALFLGRETLNDLTVASLYSREFRFTDVYIGIMMARMGLRTTHLNNLHFGANRNLVRRGALGGFYGSTAKHVNWRTGKAK